MTFVYTIDLKWWSAIVADNFVSARDLIYQEDGEYPVLLYTETEWEMMK